MKGKILGAIAAAAGLAATASLGGPAAGGTSGTADAKSNGALVAFGLSEHSDQRIYRFMTSDPETATKTSTVTGLRGDKQLVGFDYRVQDGKLYGVGDSGGVYTVRPYTGVATKVSQVMVPLEGEDFGVDFNPAADRLRIISDTGQNLRHDVNAGGVTTVDVTLTYPPLLTPATGVTAAAYTNNDLDLDTNTSLFDIDPTMDQVALQSPANSGQLSATGKLTVDAGSEAGFDIYSRLDSDGTTTSLAAYATLQVAGKYRLYKVGLLTGAAESEGSFKQTQRVVDIAIPLDQS